MHIVSETGREGSEGSEADWEVVCEPQAYKSLTMISAKDALVLM